MAKKVYKYTIEIPETEIKNAAKTGGLDLIVAKYVADAEQIMLKAVEKKYVR